MTFSVHAKHLPFDQILVDVTELSWLYFCSEMVIIICSMLAITIKDLVLRWNNKELAIGKNTVQFEPKS